MLSLQSKFIKEAAVSYIKAEKILPEDLIRQIQEYVDGVYIYIPPQAGHPASLGTGNGLKSGAEGPQ
jgi:hypothetical protein